MVNNRLQTRDVTKIYNISEMASLADIFSESEKTNWLKSWIAIDITKAGLIGFVDQEVCNVKTRIFEEAQKKLQLPATSFCTSCCTANLLRCPTINVCKRKTNAACLTHDTPGKQPRQCTLKLCDVVRDEIINEHRFSHPSWKNTSAEQWARNSWQIAKCFLPPDGYIGVSSAQDTDFNGIINIMLNCKHFDLKMSFIISSQLQNTPCLLTKAREFCKAVRHTTDCKVADADLKDMFTSLISLLSDPKSLANDQYAQEAVVKLGQLEQDSLNFAEVCQLLNESLQHAAEYNKQHFSVLEEVKAYMQTHQVEFDKHVSEQKHMICATGQTYIQLIKDATSNTEQNNYDEAVQDFRRLLKTYYDKTFSHVGLSLLKPYADMPLKDIYVKHKLFKTGKQNGQTKKTDRVYSYRELIYNEDMIFRHICIQGEPGMGKSTFAAKLLQDWCKSEVISDASDNRTAIFNDIETLQEFAFVFLILLRESNDKNDILEMIATQIIAEIYSTDEQKDACKLLKRIMKREKCLLVQDGLDEWADPKGKLAMPRIVTRYQPCTTLTTTRLWRMTDERIKDSNIDSLLELEGVDDPFELAKKVLCYLDSNSRIDTFRGYVFGNKLYELIKTPMLMSFIVCCYVDEVHLTGSHCNIYGLLLDSLFKKASKEGCFFETSPAPCLEFTKYLQPNEKCLDAMSKLAFDRLFSLDKSTSLVFSEKDLLCMSKNREHLH